MVSFINVHVAPLVVITALTSSRPRLKASSQDCITERASQEKTYPSASGEERWCSRENDFPAAQTICVLIRCFQTRISISASAK